MSENHRTSLKTETCNLQPMEAHLASACVAIIFGTIGGFIGIASLTIVTTSISTIIALLGGFVIPWLVCKYLFNTAHMWYGRNSFMHRIYDGIGIIAAIITFYLNI